MITDESKAYVACNVNCLIDMKEFLRSQGVTYTVYVIISQKRCKIDTCLNHPRGLDYLVVFTIARNLVRIVSVVSIMCCLIFCEFGFKMAIDAIFGD